MGVRGLYHYCNRFLKDPIHDNKRRIGIDASSLLYKFHGNFEKIFLFLEPLLKNKLIFIFDGKAPKYKEKELEIRKQTKMIAENRINMLKETYEKTLHEETKCILMKRIKQLEEENWHLTYTIIKDFKQYLIIRNIIYLKSIGEADSLLIDLYHNNYIDAVLSNDMDYIVANVKTMFIPVKDILKMLDLNEILEFEEINSEQFKEVAILVGIDNVRIIGIDDVSTSIAYIRHYGSINSMMIHQDNLFSPLPYPNYIQEIKKPYVPNKNIYVHLKLEDKDKLVKFNERV